MEEILASIRKIISEDSPESAPPQAQPTPVHEADVLELTQEIPEEPPPAPVAALPPADHVEFQPFEEAPVTSAAEAPSSSGEGLFSDKTRKALDDAFTSFEQPGERAPAAAAAPVAPLEGQTLEAAFDNAVRGTFDPVLRSWLDQNKDAVIERMKPVVTAWLDEHFPTMLQQAVKEELARAARSRLGR
jgi:cell pole-organizing protein PopZ